MPNYKPTRVTGAPVEGFELTLGYLDLWPPYYTAERRHLGRDYGCPTGTPIRNPYLNPVRVKAVHKVDANNKPLDGWGDGSLGNIVILDMEDTEFFGGFAHLSWIDVSPGQVLSHGQIIGLSGATGTVSGAHLHWQHSADVNFSRSAKTEDPMSGLVTATNPPAGDDLRESLNNLNAAVIEIRDAGVARDAALDTRLKGIERGIQSLVNALPKG